MPDQAGAHRHSSALARRALARRRTGSHLDGGVGRIGARATRGVGDERALQAKERTVCEPEELSHRMAYLEWTSAPGAPALVCVHGLTRNARDFDFLARQLVDHY